MMKQSRLFVGMFACGLLTGCSAQPVPTKGVVIFNGKPLANATVMFSSQEPDGQSATGFTDGAGMFVLTTKTRGDGALPGTYKVTIHHAETVEVPKGLKSASDVQKAMAEADSKRRTSAEIPEKYTRLDQTPLEARVPTEGEMKIELRGD